MYVIKQTKIARLNEIPTASEISKDGFLELQCYEEKDGLNEIEIEQQKKQSILL